MLCVFENKKELNFIVNLSHQASNLINNVFFRGTVSIILTHTQTHDKSARTHTTCTYMMNSGSLLYNAFVDKLQLRV